MPETYRRPIIGVTLDTLERPQVLTENLHYYNRGSYARAIDQAGGLPVLLPFLMDRIPEYLALCDGFLFTGGDDPDMTAFNVQNAAGVTLIDPRRQAFEMALMDALQKTQHPTLGICLGMQLMALKAGGKLCQSIQNERGQAVALRHKNNQHTVKILSDGPLSHIGWVQHTSLQVRSFHQQAVTDPGRLTALASCPEDDLLEAISGTDEDRFYIGVQWHAEKTEGLAGATVMQAFIKAAAAFHVIQSQDATAEGM